jgi:two-component system nitrogen regulation sensor histidine kinase NtrY
LKTATKIRWLLFIVTIGLFATSLTARWAATKLMNLYNVGNHITEELAKKERFVNDYLANSNNFERFKILHRDAKLATETIKYFVSENVYFQTFKNNQLTFWSDAIITANNLQGLKEGSSFIVYNNAWCEVIKKKDNDFFVVFFIPVKSKYPYQNQYLKDGFNQDLIIDRNIEIAQLADYPVADIKNVEGKYLFSIKKSAINTDIPYSKIEIIFWALGIVLLGFLINSICKFYADSGNPGLAILGLIISFAILRYLSLKYHFPEAIYSLEIFDPSVYASNFYFPSFADLAINVIALLWVVIFIHSYKSKIFTPITNKWIGYAFILYGVLFIALVSVFYSDVFFGLIFNSNINFKVSNIVNLNFISFLGIIILMLAILAYYLMFDILIYFSRFIEINIKNKIILLVAIFLIYNFYQLVFTNYNVFFILIFCLVLIVGKLTYNYSEKMIFPAALLIALLFATLVSIKLNRFENVKQLEVRKRLLLKLESADDPYSIFSFKEREQKIASDQEIKEIVKKGEFTEKQINNKFNNVYLTGDLNKFDYNVYLFNEVDSLIGINPAIKLVNYKKRVETGALKVSEYFYRVNNTFGSQSYFAIIPLKESGLKLGTLIIELQSKDFEQSGAFPHLFQNGKLDQRLDFLEYSYAFYDQKLLLNQFGSFVYDLVNTEFVGKNKDFVILKKDGFDHIIYQPSLDKIIIITHPSNTFWRELASLSFFFIIFFIFALLIVSYKWIWIILSSYEFGFRNLKFKFFIRNNKILYRTRIQIALVLAVVSSLLIIGIITFSYISIQYKEQQQDLIRNKIRIIASAFENNVPNNFFTVDGKIGNLSYEEFSKMYSTDLNLFDNAGKLVFSTQGRIFSKGLLAERLNANAFINLIILKKSEFIQEENIDKLSFTSAYMPVKNENNGIMAYLQLPYFPNQDDYNNKIGTFLNLLINIYVLVFVAIGFFAFVVANQITSPLSLIQDSISKTMIGRKNIPIEWKRNDEIGSLIKEYNGMIATLEENASKLAQSERESAWREMAKQVAHEIKNPLTPLKLGIQMLDRSWRDKDENFDDKFKKFSQSFLEQIESLSRIASEFSNFAQMPDLKLEQLELLDVLNKAIQVFNQMDHIQIQCDEASFKNCVIIADKDQLLRSFNNLLKNAIEAMPDGKEGVIKVVGLQEGKAVQVSIIDNGNGIPEELQERIFVPNFTTKSSGTGLGLAFVKQAIENMGGSISFKTKINLGTTFYITLPCV